VINRIKIMAKQVVQSKFPDLSAIDSAISLGQLIKAKRTELKIKLVDCAALCGIGVNTLSRIEKGNSNCTLGATFAVLKGLGIKLNPTGISTTDTSVQQNNAIPWV